MASLTESQVEVQDRQELYDFLEKLKLIKYYDLLCENECYPLSVLRHVDDSTLKEWGLKTIPRKAIMRAIAKISRASIPSLDKTFLAPPPSGKIAAAQLQEDARVAAEMIMKAKIKAAIGAPAPPSYPAPPGPPKTSSENNLGLQYKILRTSSLVAIQVRNQLTYHDGFELCIQETERQVQAAIQEGFVPHGSLAHSCITAGGQTTMYMTQTMVRQQ